jgi:hypothetical protein
MDVFQVHQQLIADYQAFTAGFTKIHDPDIRKHVDQRVANGDQWPDAYLSLNPNFASGGSISELVKQGFLHPECEQIFRVGKEEPPRIAGPGYRSAPASAGGNRDRQGWRELRAHHGNRIG